MKKILAILSMIFIFSFFLTFKNYAQEQIICIDPGHGGVDGGATIGDYKESNLNLDYANTLKSILENKGYKVVMTRTNDKHLSGEKFIKKLDLEERLKIINNSNCLLFISLHMNKFEEEQYSGAQTFYYPSFKENKELAFMIQESIKLHMSNTTRDIKEIESVFLLKNATKIGCLVECGFMSNKEELNNLLSLEYKYKLCDAIAVGIQSFITR